MTDSWPLRSSLELGALSTAVPCACLHVKHVLWEWGLNGLAESAELLVSELVTNAVNASGQPGQTVSLNLAGNATRVLIEVRDADPRPPAIPGCRPAGPSWTAGPAKNQVRPRAWPSASRSSGPPP
jgi:anti-sigma regulatory factor (Ser/Thr protein kinase)